MKTQFFKLFVGVIALFATDASTGQISETDNNGNFITSYVGWDNTTTFPLNLMHQNTLNPQPINFFTSNTQRMTLTGATGFPGLNTTSPTAQYHQNLGDMLVMGLTTQPANATVPLAPLTLGDRLMWIESRGAFRAGGVDNLASNFWDAANIGKHSMVLGFNSKASGENSLGLGATCLAEATSALAIGSNNKVTGNYSTALGEGNFLFGTNSYIFGISNTISAASMSSMAMGQSNYVDGQGAFALGLGNIVDNADVAGAVGKSIMLNNDASFAMGCFMESTATDNLTLGSGINSSVLMTNNVAHSMMLGFNSDYPTLFVSGGNGNVGTFGNVGIGLNASTAALTPNERLDVNGNARFRTIPDSTVHSLILGYDPDTTDLNTDDRVLTKLDFPGHGYIFSCR